MLRRRSGSDGNGKWLTWSRKPATTAPVSGELLALGAEIAGETALAAWFRAALLGQGFGLAIAKYAQMWAATTLHPVAFLGALVVLASTGLGYVAIGRYMTRTLRLAGAPCSGGWRR